ncbi:MAG: pilus assembly protein PilM [Candidatus Desulfacyla sp.]
MFFQTSMGIDIQDKAIVVAYLKASFKGAKLAAHAIYPIEEGLSSQEKIDTLEGVIRDLLDRNKISSVALFLGIPREAVVLRYVDLPLAVKENLRDSLRYELEKYVPFPPEEVIFDYQIISEDKDAGKLRLLLLMVNQDGIDPYTTAIEKIPGVRLSSIEVSSTALANFFAMLPESQGQDPYVLIYGKKSGIEINVLQSRFLAHSKPIDKSRWGEDYHQQVSQGLKKIKEKWGSSEGPLKTVVCDIQKDTALLTYLKEDIAFDIRPFDLSVTDVPSLDMIPAYGLALKGIQEVPTDINLLPKEMRKRPSRAGYYAMFGLAGIAIFLALAWIGGTIYNTQRYVSRLDREVGRLKVEATRLEQIKAEVVRIESQIDVLDPLRRDRLMVLDAIKEFSETIPKSAWLLRLTYSDKDKKIQIEGWADSASELIPLLDNSPLFSGVGFLSPITRSAGGKERFRIGLELDR